MPHLLFLAGSTRQGSYNVQLSHYAERLAQEQGATTKMLDLSQYELPLYNQDLEAELGLPEAAKALKALFVKADGIFISTPEYNSSIPPLLKNTLDWISRQHRDNEAPLIAFADKACAISAASPGGFGGQRALVPLRLWLANVNMNVVGRQLAVSQAHEAFNDQGELISDYQRKSLTAIIEQLIKISAS